MAIPRNLANLANQLNTDGEVPKIEVGDSKVEVTDTGSNGTIVFNTDNAERMRVDSSGNVGIGNTVASTINTANGVGNLVVGSGSGSEGITIYTGTAGNGGLAFADGTTTTDTYRGYINYNHGSDHMAFSTSATERARITSAGTLLVGTTSTTANGGVLQVSNGITFPATQSACSDANTLDDYEEGTWTPSLGGNTTYSIQSGKYTKIGRFVYVSAVMAVTTLGTGSTSRISGLPFAMSGSPGGGNMGGGVYYWETLAVNVITPTSYLAQSVTHLDFFSRTTAGTASTNALAIFGNSARIDFSLVYEVS